MLPLLGQSGPGSDGNEGVLCIPQSSSTAGTSPSDCLVSYPGHSSGGGSYPSAEVQSVYSTAPADWANCILDKYQKHYIYIYIYIYISQKSFLVLVQNSPMRKCLHYCTMTDFDQRQFSWWVILDKYRLKKQNKNKFSP